MSLSQCRVNEYWHERIKCLFYRYDQTSNYITAEIDYLNNVQCTFTNHRGRISTKLLCAFSVKGL